MHNKNIATTENTVVTNKSKDLIYGGASQKELLSSFGHIYHDVSPDMLGKMREHYKEVESLERVKPITHRTKLATENKSLDVRLFDVRATLKIITSEVSMYIDNECRERLFKQIDRIHDPDEWDEDDTPMDEHAFRNFIAGYLQLHPKNGPGLGVAYNGNVVAAWMSGNDRLILEFTKDGVRWVMTRYVDEEQEQISGFSSVRRLKDNLAPNICEQGFFK